MVESLTRGETREQLEVHGIGSSPQESFAFLDQADNIRYDWHTHTRHQLLYAFSGTLRLDTEDRLCLLPPQRAVWIPAGVLHRTTLKKVRSGAVFLSPLWCPRRSLGQGSSGKVKPIPGDEVFAEILRRLSE